MKVRLFLLAVGLVGGAQARTLTLLSGDAWTLDGAHVSVPHTWNAQDAADGLGEMIADGRGDSVASPSYRRCARTYARTLPANPDGYLGNCRVEPPAAGRGARENAIRELGLSN